MLSLSYYAKEWHCDIYYSPNGIHLIILFLYYFIMTWNILTRSPWNWSATATTTTGIPAEATHAVTAGTHVLVGDEVAELAASPRGTGHSSVSITIHHILAGCIVACMNLTQNSYSWVRMNNLLKIWCYYHRDGCHNSIPIICNWKHKLAFHRDCVVLRFQSS